MFQLIYPYTTDKIYQYNDVKECGKHIFKDLKLYNNLNQNIIVKNLNTGKNYKLFMVSKKKNPFKIEL